MEYTLLGSVDVSLQGQLAWLWHAQDAQSFITGDDRRSFRVSCSAPSTPEPLTPTRPLESISFPASHACNMPVPDTLYDEFRRQPWHGLEFLSAAEYDRARDATSHAIGDLVRTLTCGPNHGLYVRHPATGALLSLYSGKLLLLHDDSEAYTVVAETRTRGRSALTYAAHPSEGLLVYGDNYGGWFSQEFSIEAFGKARKFDEKTRNASAAEFIDDGSILLIGGTGYLTAYDVAAAKFTQRTEVSAAVRGLHWLPEPRLLVVNQGLNGILLYRFEDGAFTRMGSFKPPAAVGRVAVSPMGDFLAATSHGGETVFLYQQR